MVVSCMLYEPSIMNMFCDRSTRTHRASWLGWVASHVAYCHFYPLQYAGGLKSDKHREMQNKKDGTGDSSCDVGGYPHHSPEFHSLNTH
jgi:hypothetical protein